MVKAMFTFETDDRLCIVSADDYIGTPGTFDDDSD